MYDVLPPSLHLSLSHSHTHIDTAQSAHKPRGVERVMEDKIDVHMLCDYLLVLHVCVTCLRVMSTTLSVLNKKWMATCIQLKIYIQYFVLTRVIKDTLCIHCILYCNGQSI